MVQVTPLRRTLPNMNALVAFTALTLLVGRQEGHPEPRPKVKYVNRTFVMCVILVSKALRLARVNEGSRSFTCHPLVYPQME